MIIAIKDCAAGNEQVGTMWKETKVFDDSTPVGEVWEWAGPKHNLVITKPEGDE